MIQTGWRKIRAHSGSLGAPKLARTENFFSKSVFKRGVKSTRNDLICLDPKSCRVKFFSKNFENFRVDASKNSPKDFFIKKSSEGGWNRLEMTLFAYIQNPVAFHFFPKKFLVADTRLHLAVSVGLLVRWSRNIFELRAVFELLLLPHRPRLDCRVSGLVHSTILSRNRDAIASSTLKDFCFLIY